MKLSEIKKAIKNIINDTKGCGNQYISDIVADFINDVPNLTLKQRFGLHTIIFNRVIRENVIVL